MNPVALIQTEIAARLNADSYFSDVTVISEREGDIENTIDRALKTLTVKGSAMGVAVVVGVADGAVDHADIPGPCFDSMSMTVTVYENVMFNMGGSGTGKAAVDILVRVNQLLHHYQPGGIAQTITSTRDAIKFVGVGKDGALAYNSLFSVSLDSFLLDKVSSPVISPAAGGVAPQTVTITCATLGAAIYYTLDQSYPWSGNSAATLYSGAFDVTAAATLRAVAHSSTADVASSNAVFAVFT